MIKKILITVILVIVLAFFVHWTGIPLGTYVDMFLDKVFAWTNNIIPRLTEILPKFGEKIRESVSSVT